MGDAFDDQVLRSWYLIYTKPRQEQVACDNLQRQNYVSYLPKVQIKRRRLGRYVEVIEPMFPRYVFISMRQDLDNWVPIRSTRGVASIVRFGGLPAQVPDSLLEFLQQKEQQYEREKAVQDTFKRGDKVKILDPAWDHYEAVFQAKTSKKRVTVLLELLGTVTEIEVSSSLIDRY